MTEGSVDLLMMGVFGQERDEVVGAHDLAAILSWFLFCINPVGKDFRLSRFMDLACISKAFGVCSMQFGDRMYSTYIFSKEVTQPT